MTTAIATASTLVPQALPRWRRAVLKVGSSLLAADAGGLGTQHATALAAFMAASHVQGREVVLVSSGAVAAGRARLRSQAKTADGLVARQALAALGQGEVLALWQTLSARPVAQVLLTHDDVRNRRRFLNARATLRELLRLDVLPVVNENDTVAVDELKLGDNDNLAATVAVLVDADLLLIASDVAALYTADPARDASAEPVAQVAAVTPELLASAGASSGPFGTGGMRTKLEAAAKAAAAGIPTAIFSGRDVATVQALERGVLHGSLVTAAASREHARRSWLRHLPRANGRIVVDAGAAAALLGGRVSLLPGGVTGAEGEFLRGDVVDVVDGATGHVVARGLSHYNAAEVRRVLGRHSRDISTLLGYSHGDEVVHRDDMIVMPHATIAAKETTP